MSKTNTSFSTTFLDNIISYVKNSTSLTDSDIENIVNMLKSIDENDFTSEHHYMYYVRFVKPKLSRIGKTYRLPKSYYWKKMMTKLAVGIGDSYVILEFINYAIDRYDRMESRELDIYLLGKNSDNKVFVNKVTFGISDLLNSVWIYHTNDNVRVFRVEDREIKRNLGYNYESDLSEILVTTNGSYRIQGEITLNVTEIHSEEKFRELLKESFMYDIQEYVRYLFYDHVSTILSDMGFNIGVDRGSSIDIVIPYVLSRERWETDLASILIALEKRLSLENRVAVHMYDKRINVVNPYYGELRVYLMAGRGEYVTTKRNYNFSTFFK